MNAHCALFRCRPASWLTATWFFMLYLCLASTSGISELSGSKFLRIEAELLLSKIHSHCESTRVLASLNVCVEIIMGGCFQMFA